MMHDTTPWSEGDPGSSICFIGEAPGTQEIAQGRPLVGPAGQVFNQCLSAAGIIRMGCHIQNMIPHKIKDTREYLTPSGLTEVGRETRDHLVERLKNSRANVFVPLGGLAFTALTGETEIKKRRGSIYESNVMPGKKVIGTVHPALCLPHRGDYLQRYSIINDFRKVLRHSTFPELGIPDNDYIIRPSLADVRDYVKLCREQKKIGYDIEILNHQISCLAISANPTSVMCIPFMEGNQHYWRDRDEVEIWLLLHELLGDPDVGTITQYGMFDHSFTLSRSRIRIRGPVYDTHVAQRIMYPDLPAGLDYLCSVYTDIPYYKDDGKEWGRIKDNIETFWLYNCKDALSLHEIWSKQFSAMRAHPAYLRMYQDVIKGWNPILFMMTAGMKIDHERLKEYSAKITEELKQAEEKLADVSDYPFNYASPKQCVEYFYGHKGYTPYTNRKTGRPTCDDKALTRIARKYNSREARAVQRVRALKKLRSSYLEMEFDKDGRLRCFYNPRGTRFGRLSSSKTVFGTGMNMQNLHPLFKGFCVEG